MKKKTKVERLIDELNEIKLFQIVSSRTILMKIWENDDFFAQTSFDVTYIKAKRKILDKQFVRNNGNITRII